MIRRRCGDCSSSSPRLDADHGKPRACQAAVEPLRQWSGLQPHPLVRPADRMKQLADRLRLAFDLALPDQLAARIHDADAGGANRHIKTDEQLHGRPPDRLDRWSLTGRPLSVIPYQRAAGAPTTRSFCVGAEPLLSQRVSPPIMPPTLGPQWEDAAGRFFLFPYSALMEHRGASSVCLSVLASPLSKPAQPRALLSP